MGGNEPMRGATRGVYPPRTRRGYVVGMRGWLPPTVFTVGLMQGSTPRKAGCVRCRLARVIKGSGRCGASCVGLRCGRICMLTRFADAITACFPMHPAHAGCYLAVSPR